MGEAIENENKENVDEDAMGVIVIGMAGSGKSTLMQQICSFLSIKQKKRYVINLDPAVLKTNYQTNIDIRDVVNYKQVMEQYELGPNGAIMTSLNLFATRFEQVLELIEKRKKESEFVFVDTPGQIEVFTWSASGTIITDSIASILPSCVLYVVDTPRTVNPSTFMANMLYACSIFLKTKLPFIVVFNKIDVVEHDFAVQWMTDFESFFDSLNAEKDQESFMNGLNRSMSLVLEEFYSNLSHCGVSAATGKGIEQLFELIHSKRKEYFEFYKPELDAKRNIIAKQLAEFQKRAEKEPKLSETEPTIEPVVVDPSSETSSKNVDAKAMARPKKKVTMVRPGEEDEAEEYRKLMQWLKEG